MENLISLNTLSVYRGDCSIIIGNNVGMSQTTLVAKGADIIIGDNVKFGGGVKVYTTDFHCIDYMKRRDFTVDMSERKCAPVSIGEDCFIGAGTIILKGVTILIGLRDPLTVKYLYNILPDWHFDMSGATGILWGYFRKVPLFYAMMVTLPIWGGIKTMLFVMRKYDILKS